MGSEDHIIYYSLVYQVADFHQARYRWYHSQDAHVGGLTETKKKRFFLNIKWDIEIAINLSNPLSYFGLFSFCEIITFIL